MTEPLQGAPSMAPEAPRHTLHGVRVWPVGALLRAIADSLEARFNPIAVQGEISGFSRAASGHCYFSLKDEQGQVRCAMFRRAASLLDFTPTDGQLVELRGRLGVYDARGELQLVVESMRMAGQGTLFEQFLKLKARLEGEGLFDSARKRPLPLIPRAIGVVTSLGAAALHDVVTALQRRAPHIPVRVYPASVQGAQAPAELRQALGTAFSRGEVDVVLLVRGGGSMEDLWAFNDEQLARVIVSAPMPVISGVGHETDFSIADFCADLRAPTPTAAAELCVQPRTVWMDMLQGQLARLRDSVERQLESSSQRLDLAASRMSRPSHFITRQQGRLAAHAQQLRYAKSTGLSHTSNNLLQAGERLPAAVSHLLQTHDTRLGNAARHLELLNPRLVLKRGYAWLSDAEGATITSAKQPVTGQALKAVLADGEVDLTVAPRRLI